MCLNIVLATLASTTEMKLLLYSEYSVRVPVWSAKASMYIRITFVLFKALYMHLIST